MPFFQKKVQKTCKIVLKIVDFVKTLKNLEKYKWNGQLEISFFEKKIWKIWRSNFETKNLRRKSFETLKFWVLTALWRILK